MRDYSAKTERRPDDIRKDASANRKAIIKAAHHLYTNNEFDVSASQIAREAGVSRATLYRNFPDQSSIIMEVFHLNLDMLESYSKRLNNHPNQFFKLLEKIAEQQMKFQWLASNVREVDASILERLISIFRSPAESAMKSGAIRSDFKLERDLMVIVMMIGGVLTITDDGNSKVRLKRALEFVRSGIRG